MTVLREKKTGEGEGGRRGAADLWEDTLEKLDSVVDAFIRVLELGKESEYTQKMASFTGAHNSGQIDQRQ